jgi:hypothetical protein
VGEDVRAAYDPGMSGIVEHLVRRTSIALMTTAGALLLLALPTPDLAASLSVGALALTLAALVSFGLRGVTLTSRTTVVVPTSGDPAPPMLPGRATDPLHHPLRPRAPGTA